MMTSSASLTTSAAWASGDFGHAFRHRRAPAAAVSPSDLCPSRGRIGAGVLSSSRLGGDNGVQLVGGVEHRLS
jgi:hypothetical protein